MTTSPATRVARTRKARPSLEERALAVLETRHLVVDPTTQGVWLVESSTAGEFHKTSTLQCSCPAGQRGVPCQHRAAVSMLLAVVHPPTCSVCGGPKDNAIERCNWCVKVRTCRCGQPITSPKSDVCPRCAREDLFGPEVAA